MYGVCSTEACGGMRNGEQNSEKVGSGGIQNAYEGKPIAGQGRMTIEKGMGAPSPPRFRPPGLTAECQALLRRLIRRAG